MNSVPGFAIIGAGWVAQSYAQAFHTCNEARAVAVVDIRQEAAQALAERLGCPAFKDADALLRSGLSLDAVIICTPPNTHEDVALTFLEHRIPVLCEKPLCLDSLSASRLIQKAHSRNTLLTMASKFRYVTDVIKARDLLTSGIIGEPRLLENVFMSYVDMSRRWNSQPAVSGGGVLIDNGTHSVDLMRLFLGPLTEALAIETTRLQDVPVEDTVQLFLRSADGVVASSSLSWSISRDSESYLSIYGTEGTIHVGWRVSKYNLHSRKDSVIFGNGYDKTQAFKDQIVNFARAIRGEEPLRISSEDALASVQVIEAAYESMRNCRWTPVRCQTGVHSPNSYHRSECLDRARNLNLGQCSHPARH
jgi:predicted dehydrogenase